MLQFYSEFIGENDLCFDIGANIGNRARIFLRLDAKVVAVEPQPLCVSALRKYLGDNQNLFIEPLALGTTEGAGEIRINRGSTISSMSLDWIQAVTKSGRFGTEQWETSMQVSITTLDMLIAKYGTPAFIKIDVEGFESEVLRGLSTKVRTISIEFTPEFIDATYAAIEHISKLGQVEFNLVLGEDMHFTTPVWFQLEALKVELQRYVGSHTFGDVYIRFIDQS